MEEIVDIYKEGEGKGKRAGKRKETAGKDSEEQFRIVINKEGNEALEMMTKRANEGFEGGEISKSAVAELILLNAVKTFSEAEIKNLRSMNFDEQKMLGALLRKSREDGTLPDEIRKALRDHFGLNEQNKKRQPKNQHDMLSEKNPILSE